MKIFVNDTNILIDLAEIDLLEAFSKLDALLYTTDVIIAELEISSQKEKINYLIEQGILEVLSIKSEELIEIYTLKEENTGLSFEDCSVWYAAEKHQGTLLTGDGKLRKQAVNKGADVRGILYLFDEFVKNGILEYPTARQKLIRLREMNTRLPEKEINKRLRYWKNK